MAANSWQNWMDEDQDFIFKERTPCERCYGTGTMKLTGSIRYFDGRHEVANQKPMRCTDCYGRGSISGLTRKMRRIAEHIRKGRIELDVTQREQAQIVGMSFSEWNDIIRGRVELEAKDGVEAENKRLREALIKIRSPHVSDPTPENIAREALK